ncbi:hypothetical protein PUN28_015048 [Cardiocondyla obscurior]|uniref:Uncharacterized protein n=1 Tax=Cardiocondyla obscurior TaxID=286306 RepID=A0AAW2F0H8_9HYME
MNVFLFAGKLKFPFINCVNYSDNKEAEKKMQRKEEEKKKKRNVNEASGLPFIAELCGAELLAYSMAKRYVERLVEEEGPPISGPVTFNRPAVRAVRAARCLRASSPLRRRF